MPLRIHFLNVGAGDSTIVDFPARTKGVESFNARIMMIDINSCPDNGYTDVIEYFKAKFSQKSIFRFVCTHPHKDHITGINELFNKSGISINNFWDVKNEFYPEDWENDPSPEDWEMYEKIKNGKISGLTVRNYTSETNPVQCWNEDEIQILSPSSELITYAHTKQDGTKRSGEAVCLNEISSVLLMKVNARKIVFAADAEGKAWEEIISKKRKEIENVHILKASHHGRESGFNEEAVKIMNPEYILFSNSTDADKNHGAEKLYKKAAPKAQILKTSIYGNLIAEISYSATIATKWTND
ncbi:hypothetical protein GCM10028803_15840 [Larkinella knui]|uniref:MBL fold metallo-hydrolase n=1 Tax=Larkinella knui TaxID=2025310 RepID=A0A3P1C9L7_9BACT|nr:hypothetical protein [Larkinella knui]RRB09953.1 hypothetical protein EHT87_31025 [Larkinella knui]